MGAEARTLPLEIPAEPVIVESRLADRDDLRARRPFDERRHVGLDRVRIVGMRADGRVQVRMLRGERMHPRPVGQVDRDAQRMRHPRFAHGPKLRGQVAREFGKVEVAVRIDEHGSCQLTVVSCQWFGADARHAGTVRSC
ncbi:MAG: hypothetical protein AMXMBFR42_17860 [Burkholderiales bacterium]